MASDTGRIVWIAGGITRSAAGEYRSVMASNRYRVIAPAAALASRGHRVEIIDPLRWDPASSEPGDTIIVGKMLPSSQASRDDPGPGRLLIDKLQRALGATIVSDFCDDKFGDPLLGPVWIALAGVASVCTAASTAMADAVRPYARVAPVTIDDPILSPLLPVKVFRAPRARDRLVQGLLRAPASPLKLVWYGHPSNWKAMSAWLPRLAQLARQQPLVLTVVTHLTPAIAKDIEDHGSSNLRITGKPWSEDMQWAEVEQAHVVLVPSDPGVQAKSVKSANRVTDAMHCGRLVVASTIAAYERFRPWVRLTDDPVPALLDYLEKPQDFEALIANGQREVQTTLSVECIADQWERILAPKPASAPAAAPQPGRSKPEVRDATPSFHPGQFGPYGEPFLTRSRYAVKERTDLFALLPTSFRAASMLEIGCADGANLRYFARELKVPAEMCTGVDICRAEGIVNEGMDFHHASAETFLATSTRAFDLILLSDVLEHIYNPWALLAQVRPRLSAQGVLLISVPNVQNFRYLSAVASGAFLYQSSGLFDETHIRFFSVQSLRSALDAGGFEVVASGWRPDRGFDEMKARALQDLARHGSSRVEQQGLSLTLEAEAQVHATFGQQILMAAVRKAEAC